MTYNIYCWGVLYKTGVPAEDLGKYNNEAFAIEEVA